MTRIAPLACFVLTSALARPSTAQYAPAPYGAQPTAPGGMQSGGLAPPAPESGPPPPQPQTSLGTQKQLEEASAKDSGRGLEFFYFNVEGGFEYLGLQSLSSSNDLVPNTVHRSDVGSLLGAGTGLRLLFLTVGPRFRFGHFKDWNLWTLDLEAGWHVPLGQLEPYATLGAGYARMTGGQASDIGASVKGYNLRLSVGLDYYVTSVLSVGATVDGELVRLSREAVAAPTNAAAQALWYTSDASGLGLGFTGAAVVGLHF